MFNKSYRVKDVVKIIDRDKSTLFRWEKEGKIVPPRRDSRGWRVYTEKNVKEMRNIINQTVEQYN